jgi:hypothetical protein
MQIVAAIALFLVFFVVLEVCGLADMAPPQCREQSPVFASEISIMASPPGKDNIGV